MCRQKYGKDWDKVGPQIDQNLNIVDELSVLRVGAIPDHSIRRECSRPLWNAVSATDVLSVLDGAGGRVTGGPD